jgi:hypothetical protein
MYWVCVSFCNIWNVDIEMQIANSMLKCRDWSADSMTQNSIIETTEFSVYQKKKPLSTWTGKKKHIQAKYG